VQQQQQQEEASKQGLGLKAHGCFASKEKVVQRYLLKVVFLLQVAKAHV
jgi:hypothetical protein